jgi:hypothetical protein
MAPTKQNFPPVQVALQDLKQVSPDDVDGLEISYSFSLKPAVHTPKGRRPVTVYVCSFFSVQVLSLSCRARKPKVTTPAASRSRSVRGVHSGGRGSASPVKPGVSRSDEEPGLPQEGPEAQE